LTKYKGLITDLSNELYHADRTHYSSSVLKQALKDPQEFKRIYVDGGEPKPMSESALAIGNYCHLALLEPHLLNSEAAVFPGARRSGNAWKLFKTENEGKTIVTEGQLDLINTMLTEFNQGVSNLGNGLETNKNIFKGGVAEESLFITLDRMPIKVRFDYKIDKGETLIIRDLKTTRDTANTPEEARRICEQYGYYLSSALYTDALMKFSGVNKVEFHLVFLSKQDFRTNVYKVGKSSMEKGRGQYKEAIEMIKKFKKTGVYSLGLREI